MNLESLENKLHSEYGLTIDKQLLAGRKGLIVLEEGKAPYIAIDGRLARREQAAVAYHEVGHLQCGLTDRTGFDELRADRWAFAQLICVEELIEAIKEHPRTLYELAELMNLDMGLLNRYLTYMSERYVYQECGDHIVSYNPIMVFNWKTEQFWPEEN